MCACVCVLPFYFCPKCIVKMCRLSAMHLSRCVVFGQGALCVCVCVCVHVFFLFISALNALSRCVVFRQCTCQDVSSLGRGPCVCVLSFYFCPKCIVKMCRLSAMHLSRCVVFGQGALCVHVCVFYLFISALNALSRCVVFRQCTCQDVSSLGRGPCVCVHVCVCVLPFYFCPKCIVKMCRLSAMHLSRCVVFGQGALCVCSFFLFLP